MLDILDSAKNIYELVKNSGNLDLLEKVADLREKILVLREENQKLKEDLHNREKYNMTFEHNVYWDIKTGKKEGPFCSSCWDNNQKAIRMIIGQNDLYTCPVCKNTIKGSNYKSPAIHTSGHRKIICKF